MTSVQVLNDAYKKVKEQLSVDDKATCRATTKLTKIVLLHNPTIEIGNKDYEVKAKSVGAGVYELSLKKTHP